MHKFTYNLMFGCNPPVLYVENPVTIPETLITAVGKSETANNMK